MVQALKCWDKMFIWCVFPRRILQEPLLRRFNFSSLFFFICRGKPIYVSQMHLLCRIAQWHPWKNSFISKASALRNSRRHHRQRVWCEWCPLELCNAVAFNQDKCPSSCKVKKKYIPEAAFTKQTHFPQHWCVFKCVIWVSFYSLLMEA